MSVLCYGPFIQLLFETASPWPINLSLSLLVSITHLRASCLSAVSFLVRLKMQPYIRRPLRSEGNLMTGLFGSSGLRSCSTLRFILMHF